ncbi:MAG TPA: GIY-YIG nuclease family protein [Methanotrichaceae archaeon]|nr:GIY-YIG nuclease family protein [Methanotrichaceae archaeon]
MDLGISNQGIYNQDILNQGIYTIILELDNNCHIQVGALGKITFPRGYYCYTGSARGPGGFKRIERHKRVQSGSSQVRRWHIDYLLPHALWVDAVVTQTREDLECIIALKIGLSLRPVPGFGSTDCQCPGHLHYSDDLGLMAATVESAHSGISL